MSLESFHADKLFHIDFERLTMCVVAAKGEQDARIYLVAEQDRLRVDVFAQIVLVLLSCLHQEALDIRITFVVGIIEHSRPHL